jgi:DNA repair photolyase
MKTTHILKQAIEEIKADPMIKQKDDDQIIMSELCDKIQIEQNGKLTKDALDFLDEHGPSGVAVFLTVMVPFQRNHKELSYLTLENDALSGWSIAYYIDFGSTGQYKLKKRHEIKSTKPNFIMTEFAKVYKAYLGKEAHNL